MNERIKELYEQAHERKPTIVIDPVTFEPVHKIGNYNKPMYHNALNPEKFAELIVRECVEVCNQHPSRIVSNNWIADSVAPDIVSRLKEHFGLNDV